MPLFRLPRTTSSVRNAPTRPIYRGFAVLGALGIAAGLAAGCTALGSTTAADSVIEAQPVAQIEAPVAKALPTPIKVTATPRPIKPRPVASKPANWPATKAAAPVVKGPSTVSRTSLTVPSGSGTGRRVVYAKGQQRVWLVDGSETVLRTYLVSGLMSQPDPGTYSVYSKSLHAASAVQPPATMQYMVRFARGKATGAPIGFHDIPHLNSGGYEQTEAQLGTPISAGCVRQKRSDAAALWAFAPVGTTVIVVR